jgi:hypothetical protein
MTCTSSTPTQASIYGRWRNRTPERRKCASSSGRAKSRHEMASIAVRLAGSRGVFFRIGARYCDWLAEACPPEHMFICPQGLADESLVGGVSDAEVSCRTSQSVGVGQPSSRPETAPTIRFCSKPVIDGAEPPTSALRFPPSAFRPPLSALRPPASSLQPPASNLQPPASSLQPPAPAPRSAASTGDRVLDRACCPAGGAAGYTARDAVELRAAIRPRFRTSALLCDFSLPNRFGRLLVFGVG